MIFLSCVFSSCRNNKMKSDKLSLSLRRKFYRNKIKEIVSVSLDALLVRLSRRDLFSRTKKLSLSIEGPYVPMWSSIGMNRHNRRFVMPRLTWNTSTMPSVMHIKCDSVLRISWRRNAMNEDTAISAYAGGRSVTAGVPALLLLNGRPRLIARQYSK